MPLNLLTILITTIMNPMLNKIETPLSTDPSANHVDNPNELSLHDRFCERVQQISSSWYVRANLISMMTLMLLFPLYDLFTGNISYVIWILLIVSVLMLGYMYVLVYMVGYWNEARKMMLLPSGFVGLLVLMLITFLGAFYTDLFIVSSWYPYLVPIGVAMFSIFVAFVRFVYNRRLLKKRHLPVG